MATRFFDNFASYTPGSTNINGFVWENGGSPIVDFGTMTGSSSATGFFERSGQGLSIVGGVISDNDSDGLTTNAQVNIMHWGSPSAFAFNNLQICTFDNANLSGGTTTNNPVYTSLCGFNINNDYTVSFVAISTITGPPVYGNGVYVVTSTEQVFWPDTWQYYQMQCTIGTFIQLGTINPGTYVEVTGTFAVDGTVVLAGTCTTSFLQSNLYLGALNYNQLRFPGRFGFTRFLGDMAGYSGTDTITMGSYAFGTAPIHDRVTQAVVEVGRTPGQRNARVTQGVVEVPRKPSFRNLRWTQGVVEIIRRGTPGGWTVYET